MTRACIFDIKRFAVHDGDGIRTTVFFKGCPLRCRWCHNPEGLQAWHEIGFYPHKCIGCGACSTVCPTGARRTEDLKAFDRDRCTVCGACIEACPAEALQLHGREVTVAELLPELTADVDFYRSSGGGVTLSGGECLLYPDFCAELLSELKRADISTAVDTCGCVPRSAIDAVLPFTDVWLYDIKAVDPAVHERCTGRDNALILDGLRYIDSLCRPIEVRFPYVPGFNDGEAAAVAELLSGLRSLTGVRILPYHGYAENKYRSLGMEYPAADALPPDRAALDEAKDLMRRVGINVIE